MAKFPHYVVWFVRCIGVVKVVNVFHSSDDFQTALRIFLFVSFLIGMKLLQKKSTKDRQKFEKSSFSNVKQKQEAKIAAFDRMCSTNSRKPHLLPTERDRKDQSACAA
uniref:Uncharacterized protein n=1 Tax=Helicotheca tamesis TaxID=374047 RepID=A0A7S2HVR4_9STRA|mmetsp:Transcript_3054/g.4139  ORF Transcript_3054/g.4139 Transcript_3054/m.4139 type:complete len:108 (+) Transcript_3054:166-489(+)